MNWRDFIGDPDIIAAVKKQQVKHAKPVLPEAPVPVFQAGRPGRLQDPYLIRRKRARRGR